MNRFNSLLTLFIFSISLALPLSAKHSGNVMDCSWLNGSPGENGHDGIPNGNCNKGGNGGNGVSGINNGSGGNGGNGASNGGAGGDGGSGASNGGAGGNGGHGADGL